LDDWGAYDQVWDMRFVDENKEKCGSGDPSSADYFNAQWRHQAEEYLRYCGKLFIAGENYQLTDRNEGLYAFLKQIGAVKPGFSTCPPSRRGNSVTENPEIYKVMNGLSPSLFWGAYVGGIPLEYLTGTSFVQTREGWQDNDRVDRSIASGWEGSQLSGLAGEMCAKGRFFLVWDATMWSLWNLSLTNPDEIRENEEDQKITLHFFPAVAEWLGGWDCPCGSPMPKPSIHPAGDSATPVPKPVLLADSAATNKNSESAQSLLSSRPRPSTGNPVSLPGPVTISFTLPPVNIYVHFADGSGQYQLMVEDNYGRLLKTLLDAPVTGGTESWFSWNGLTPSGKWAGPGLYPAVLSKNGVRLRTLILHWLPVP
jgi:hypothetical protein